MKIFDKIKALFREKGVANPYMGTDFDDAIKGTGGGGGGGTGVGKTMQGLVGKPMASRVLADEEKKAMKELKEIGEKLHNFIDRLGESREIHIAKLKAEEAVFWATKHLSR